MRITHAVIKMEDARKYLDQEEFNQLLSLIDTICEGRREDGKPFSNYYMIVNWDEPYAQEVWEIIKRNEGIVDETVQEVLEGNH